ncbi:Type II secretion system (T2SS), protein M [Tepidimonas alkaliphilus]|uniref:Type II secretion system (T2SS), protein M n=1 Tax=Tepidimonas alkaliphilus TaxID=2588942 RepID=A0A554W5J7_9BURK|nr:type II secretion system protein GspM [Tepidimonas alkaliphilus]TSE18851.1 Type II secretion system (T2SS), protein M [Tepidimonas alkaliphilus]
MTAVRAALPTLTARLPAPLRRHAGLLLALGLLLAWGFGVAWPAWRALQQAPQRLAHAQAQAQRTAALAQALAERKAAADASTALPATLEAVRALTQERLGASAQVRADDGGGWRVELAGVPAQALAHWLVAVRERLALQVVELDLQREGELWRGQARLAPMGGAQ